MWRYTLILLSVVCLCIAVAAADTLRVCADPDNLPFTSAQPDRPGMYLELAQVLADRLGNQIEYVWWHNDRGGRSIRLTLLAHKCDLYFGLPARGGFMAGRIILSEPFLTVGYALVLPPSMALTSLKDLKGKKVGVQFSSPPQHMLVTRSGIETVTFLYPEEAMQALHKRDIDAAFIWGPTAGYLNAQQFDDAWQILPMAGPDLQWPVAIGLRRGSEVLKARIDGALSGLQATIARLAGKYGFPTRAPQPISWRPNARPTAAESQRVAVATDNSAANHLSNPFRGDATAGREGNSLLNQYCSHCHGPNALSAERRTNLRRLSQRYPDTHDLVFYSTVSHGRPARGMPKWGGVLSPEQLWKIKTFLDSVQQTE